MVPDNAVFLQQNTRLMRSISVQGSLISSKPFSCSSVRLENRSKSFVLLEQCRVLCYKTEECLQEFEELTLWRQWTGTLWSWWRRSGPHRADPEGCLSGCSGAFPPYTLASWREGGMIYVWYTVYCTYCMYGIWQLERFTVGKCHMLVLISLYHDNFSIWCVTFWLLVML